MATQAQQFTGLVAAIGAETFLQMSGATGVSSALLLMGTGPSVAQQIAVATSTFAPFVGTVQTVSGFPTQVLQRLAIEVI